jgi:hypothetical protein
MERNQLIVIVVIVVVIAAVAGGYYFLSQESEENGNGNGNGNGSNQDPEAGFYYNPTEVVVNVTITFNGGNSTDPDGDTLTYKWDFDDPNSDPSNPNSPSGKIVEHYFSEPGSYDVVLTVDDGHGGNDTEEKTINVKDEEYPTVELTAQHNPTYPTLTNTQWTVSIQSETGSNDARAQANVKLVITDAAESVERVSIYVNMLETPSTPPLEDNTIYYIDNGDSSLSGGDQFFITDDGGYSIQSTDIFKLIYAPTGVSVEMGRDTLD